ncbi:MAG: dialkylresorcinol condensing enzyme, partial [Gammaproteobacteria bacterium]
FTAFLQSEDARRLLQGKPVITLIACRNMWLMAQEEMKKLLKEVDAHLVGNAVLIDEAGSLWSLLATPIWVLSGRKGPTLGGLIPRAGVAEAAIRACDRFGARLLERFRAGENLQGDVLQGLDAVCVDEKLILSERTARRGFRVWGGLIRASGPHGAWQRKPILAVYAVFLFVFLLTFVPVTMVVKKIMAPFMRRQIQEQKDYFSQLSGAE